MRKPDDESRHQAVSGAEAGDFVVTRSVVCATVDMGVGYGGLLKLCRHLDTSAMTM